MRVLVLDNYDSFTWNLVQGIEAHGGECTVVRSDAIDVGAALALSPDRVVISPGPFGPGQTGVCGPLLAAAPPELPFLGVCLGLQLIAHVAGARVMPSGVPVHGKVREIRHDGRGIFRGLPEPLRVGLYHSLVVEPGSVPEHVTVSAQASSDGTIMGARLAGRPVDGVQFHPESFLTEAGDRLLANFLEGVDVER